MKKKIESVDIVILSLGVNAGIMFEGDLFVGGEELSVPEPLAKNLINRGRALAAKSTEGKKYLKSLNKPAVKDGKAAEEKNA